MIEDIFMRGDGLDAVRIGLGVVSLLASLGYMAIEHQAPSALRTGLKTLSIGLFAPIALLLVPVPGAPLLALLLLALAFAFSSLGDLLLAMKGNPRNFLRGLVAFLISHLFYVAVMLPMATAPEGLLAQAASVAVGLAMLVFYFVLKPRIGDMRYPFIAYFLTILVMVLSALAIPAGQPLLGIGAILFLISDSVIAFDRVHTPVPGRGFIVWTTYYGGQVLIGLSLLSLMV